MPAVQYHAAMPAKWSHFARKLPIVQIGRAVCDLDSCRGHAVAECGWWLTSSTGHVYGRGAQVLCAVHRDGFLARHPNPEPDAPWPLGYQFDEDR